MSVNISKPKPKLEPGRFFTVADLALRWQLSQKSIRRMIVGGSLSVQRFGRLVRVAPSEVARVETERRAR